MDKPEILEAVIAQLPLRDQLACTLVCSKWHTIVKWHIDSAYLKKTDSAGLASQANTLRVFRLDKSSSHLLPELGKLSRLTTLTITPAPSPQHGSSDARSAYIHNSLADLLVQLPVLAHLSLLGQDVRAIRPSGPRPSPADGLLGGALIAFAKSRSDRGQPGLRSLSVIALPCVSDYGIISYLTYQPRSQSSSSRIAPEHASCGYSLRSLTLVSCRRLTSAVLTAVSQSCPQLVACMLQYVDGLFQPGGHDQAISRDSAFNALAAFAQCCRAVQRLTISLGDVELSPSAFDSFRDHPSLRRLSLTSSRHISRRHLASFNTLQRLSIFGCPALGADLPFASLPDLREFTYLGHGLSVRSLGQLFMHCKHIQRVSIDVAEQYRRSSRDTDREPQISAPSTQAALPEALVPFSSVNLLSPQLPSWALAYILSWAPSTLEDVSLKGTSLEAAKDAYATAPAFCAWWLEQRKHACARHCSHGGRGTYGEAFLWLFGMRLPRFCFAWLTYGWSFLCKAFEYSEKDPKRKGGPSAESAVRGLQPADVRNHAQVQSASLARDPITSTTSSVWESDPVSSRRSIASLPPDYTASAAPLQATPSSRDQLEDTLADLLRLPAPSSMNADQSYAPRSRLSPEQTEWLHKVTGNQFARLDV